MTGKAGEAANPVGRRVDNKALLDMNAYLDSLPAPSGAKVDPTVAARGLEVFRTNCTQCHNVDQSTFVPPVLFEMKTMWPAYFALPVGKRGDSKLSTIMNSSGTFDDKMIVVDASDRGEPRGVSVPLLLDLDRTTLFLHDASIRSLDELLDPSRGKRAPHPFYLEDKAHRDDVVTWLRSLDTGSSAKTDRSGTPR
jgi:cytochrome c peroxidase